jgi:hypothetical protein
MREIIVTAVVGAALVGTARAGFVGMDMRFDEAATLDARAVGGALAAAQVYRLYAVFDDPGNVLLNVFNVNLNADNGSTLFQTPGPFGGDTAPNSGFFGFDATLPYDSFVTMNELSNLGSTTVTLDNDFAWGASGVAGGGWFNSSPPNLLGQSVQNGSVYEVLLAQFTLESVTTSGYWVGTGGVTFNQGLGTTTTQLSWGGAPGGDPTIVPYPPPPAPGPASLLAIGGVGAALRRRR